MIVCKYIKNKIKEEEMQGIKHYLINTKSVFDDYNVCAYQKDARKILNELIKENKNVLIVGGTGLYLKALLYDYKFDEENITNDYSKYTLEELVNAGADYIADKPLQKALVIKMLNYMILN